MIFHWSAPAGTGKVSDTVPLAAEEITPEWLTTALRETGVLSRTRVRTVDYRRIGEGRCVNCVLQLTITYDPPDAAAPGSLVAKLPSLDSEGCPRGTALGVMEIRFYRELAPQTNIPTIRHYYSAWNDAGAFVLLLEDLGAGRVGRIDECCSVEDARVALTHLARFHGSGWSCPDSTTPDWLSTWREPAPDLFQGTWPVFAGKFPDLVTDDIDSIAETIGARAQEIYAGLAQQPFTVIHCDFRLDNLCFDSPSGDPVAVFGWQLIRKGRSS